MSPVTDSASMKNLKKYKDTIHSAARDESLVALRIDMARFVAATFAKSGEELHVYGHIVGPDRASGMSPFGNGSDETVAVSILLRIGSQLLSASADLFEDGRSYAAAALLRQLVEIEYLAWAMEARNGEGERWLRSDRKRRESLLPRSCERQRMENFAVRTMDFTVN